MCISPIKLCYRKTQATSIFAAHIIISESSILVVNWHTKEKNERMGSEQLVETLDLSVHIH